MVSVLPFSSRFCWDHLAREQGFALDPSKVALALIGGHGLADFVKVLHHGRFTFDAKLGGLGERQLDFRRYRVGCREKLLNFGILVINAAAELRAFWVIGIVQLDDLSKLSIGKLVLVLEPASSGRVLCSIER